MRRRKGSDKEWDGKCYDYNGIEIYEIINGEGYILKYDEDKLIFEGVYLNGEKNGLGKEYYYNRELKFEGEYKNGKKWNGKEYDYKEKKTNYEIKDGKGYIKEYTYLGELKYECE